MSKELLNWSSDAYMSTGLATTEKAKSFIKILIVDDRAAVRESLRTILSLEEDFMVIGEASSGREAVEVARSLHPDLILMDLEMPDASGQPVFDGIEACAHIKQDWPSSTVVILTVHADIASRKRAGEAGCDLFLEKGINSMELLGMLRRLSGL